LPFNFLLLFLFVVIKERFSNNLITFQEKLLLFYMPIVEQAAPTLPLTYTTDLKWVLVLLLVLVV